MVFCQVPHYTVLPPGEFNAKISEIVLVIPHRTIPSVPPWPRLATTNAEAISILAHCACPARRVPDGKEGWGVYVGVGDTLLPPFLLAVHVCSLCV